MRKLLAWAVYGLSPLELEELEEVLAIQMESKSRESINEHRVSLRGMSSPGRLVFCSKSLTEESISFHQSARHFLLKDGRLTVAVFCDSLHPRLYLAKVCMVYLNFKDFETGPCRDKKALEERKRKHPLLDYAAHNWHRHIRSDDDTSGISNILSLLIEPGSPTLLAWGEACGLPDIDKAVDTLDVAIRAKIAWLAELQSINIKFGEDRVVQEANNGAVGYSSVGTLVKRGDFRFNEEAIHALASRFDQGTVQL